MTSTRLITTRGLSLSFLGFLAATGLQAGPTLLTFDENGNSSGLAGMTWEQGVDDKSATGTPSGGGATTLDYLFPITGSSRPNYGWLAIFDANGTTLSDLIHFDNSTTIGGVTTVQMFFYSLDNEGAQADHSPSATTIATILGKTSGQYTNNVVALTENANGDSFYTPSALTSPGYDVLLNGSGAASPAYTYEFVSAPDAVSTMSLLGSSLAALALCARHRRRN